MSITYTKPQLLSIIESAVRAANVAGDTWLESAKPTFSVHDDSDNPIGTLFDRCGNAYLEFKDRRSTWFKTFRKFELTDQYDPTYLSIPHKHSHRQEHELKLRCAHAARKIFEDAGITGINIKDYVD